MPTISRPHLKVSAVELLSMNLKRIRAERGWSQEELAYWAGLPRTYIGQFERKVRNPTLATVESLAAALNIPFAELFRVPSDEKDSM
jgi:transcriptional regulator with XRE-family HTH domain